MDPNQSKIDDLSKELKKAINEVSRLDKIKTNFMIMINRELRNPLNNIVGTLNLIKNQEQSLTIKNLVETLDVSVMRLEDFTTKAVLATQLSLRSYDLKMSEFSLKELIQYAVVEKNFFIQRKEIEVIANVKDSALIKADKDLIFKALICLFDNAIKNTPDKGKIYIEINREKDKIICYITDSGKGFLPEVLASDFESYLIQSGEGEARLCLSLYFIKQVMEAHYGQFILSNKENSGACVKLVFNS
jgi:K+-sensing histidine kinase KdpD